jgi:hypothetical protein
MSKVVKHISRASERRSADMRIDLVAGMLVPVAAIMIAMILLRPILREGLFAGPEGGDLR